MKKYFAECVGTFVLTFLGCGTAMFLGCGTPAGVVGTAIAFGLAVVAMAYTIGEISGCHINPAITLGVALSGRMSWKDAVGYWVGQVIGGILAGAVLLLLTKVVAAPDLTGGLGSNGVANAGGVGGAFLVEVIATFLFVLVVLGTTDAKYGAGKPAGHVHQPHRHLREPGPFHRPGPLRRRRRAEGCVGVHLRPARGWRPERLRLEGDGPEGEVSPFLPWFKGQAPGLAFFVFREMAIFA